MRRSRFAFIGVALLSLSLGLSPGVADAKKKPRAAKVTKVAAPKADAKAIAGLMGQFKFGMTPEEVLGVLGKQIDEKYAERVKETSDVYKQDRFRAQGKEELNRIKKTFVKFEGQKTGWDVSLIDREFGQKNDEAMLVYWENDPTSNKDQRRFFFFVDGKLWKMFIAFNAELFQGKTFADFQGIMEGRFGRAAAGSDRDTKYLFWRSGNYYLRAIDLTSFYGNFCVAVSDDSVESTMAARRETRNPKVMKANSIVDAVRDEGRSADDKSVPLTEQNKDVIDQMTKGK